jgi:hypothetical protein
MSARIIRFPTHAVVVRRAPERAWYVLGEKGHGWLHGSCRDAVQDGVWLARNLNLRLRLVVGDVTR